MSVEIDSRWPYPSIGPTPTRYVGGIDLAWLGGDHRIGIVEVDEFRDSFGVLWKGEVLGVTHETLNLRLWRVTCGHIVGHVTMSDRLWQSMKRWEAPWWRRWFGMWRSR